MAGPGEDAKQRWGQGSERLRRRFDRLWHRFRRLPGPLQVCGWLSLGYWLLVLQVFRSRTPYRSPARFALYAALAPWIPMVVLVAALPRPVGVPLLAFIIWPFLAAAVAVGIGGFLAGHVTGLGAELLGIGAEGEEMAAGVAGAGRGSRLAALLGGLAGSAFGATVYASLRQLVKGAVPDPAHTGFPVEFLDTFAGWALAVTSGFGLGAWAVRALRRGRRPPAAAG